MIRFYKAPQKLYFSFDAEFKSIFSNEYMAEQLERNERLEAQNTELEARITRLQVLLSKAETESKEALKASEDRLREVKAETELVIKDMERLLDQL